MENVIGGIDCRYAMQYDRLQRDMVCTDDSVILLHDHSSGKLILIDALMSCRAVLMTPLVDLACSITCGKLGWGIGVFLSAAPQFCIERADRGNLESATTSWGNEIIEPGNYRIATSIHSGSRDSFLLLHGVLFQGTVDTCLAVETPSSPFLLVLVSDLMIKRDRVSLCSCKSYCSNT